MSHGARNIPEIIGVLCFGFQNISILEGDLDFVRQGTSFFKTHFLENTPQKKKKTNVKSHTPLGK